MKSHRSVPPSTSRLEGGVVTHVDIDHTEFGLPETRSIDALRGGGPRENARIVHGILCGEITDARRNFVLMNAAAGFVVAGLANSLAQGVELGLAQIASGRAHAKLEAARSA